MFRMPSCRSSRAGNPPRKGRSLSSRTAKNQWLHAVAVGALLLSTVGCFSLKNLLAEARVGTPEERRSVLLELEEVVRDVQPGDPRAEQARAEIDEFLRTRFEEGGTDPVERTQLVALALQGQFPSTAIILSQAAQDEVDTVRLVAVQGMRDVQPPNLQETLTALLLNDTDLFVRIEAAKVIARVGDASWVPPLAKIVINPAEDPSLRYQAHRAGLDLLDTEFEFLPARWREWLESNQ